MLKLFFIIFSLFAIHPVHVSMSSLYEDSESDHMILSVRMYSDDLALDLYRLYDAEGVYNELDHQFLFTGSDSLYKVYIDDHLKIYIDGVALEKELMKKEVLDLETLLQFRVDIRGRRKGKIYIENKILTGLYIDQVNLFILKINDSEKGVRFTSSKTEELFAELK